MIRAVLHSLFGRKPAPPPVPSTDPDDWSHLPGFDPNGWVRQMPDGTIITEQQWIDALTDEDVARNKRDIHPAWDRPKAPGHCPICKAEPHQSCDGGLHG